MLFKNFNTQTSTSVSIATMGCKMLCLSTKLYLFTYWIQPTFLEYLKLSKECCFAIIWVFPLPWQPQLQFQRENKIYTLPPHTQIHQPSYNRFITWPGSVVPVNTIQERSKMTCIMYRSKCTWFFFFFALSNIMLLKDLFVSKLLLFWLRDLNLLSISMWK